MPRLAIAFEQSINPFLCLHQPVPIRASPFNIGACEMRFFTRLQGIDDVNDARRRNAGLS